MTIIVGITGGIGSGKTTFSEQVLKRGLMLLDSDKVVGELYKKPSGSFLEHLKKIGLGGAIKGKKINKKHIAKIIFNNTKVKTELQNYIFKFVRKQRSLFLKKEKRKKTKIIFLDVPLLFENNLLKEFDILISIISKKKNRYKRLKKYRNMNKDLFKKIVMSQTTDVVRKLNSDIIVYNNKNMKDYLHKINTVLNKIAL
ncbi:dephospho-CoA kinase [Pelagibacteraceae bacterium]|nr:dephospho-CoA kinase [Pelagibacteraceae bacterium]